MIEVGWKAQVAPSPLGYLLEVHFDFPVLGDVAGSQGWKGMTQKHQSGVR